MVGLKFGIGGNSLFAMPNVESIKGETTNFSVIVDIIP